MKNKKTEMSHKRVLVTNFGSLTVVQIASYVLPLVYLPYLVRIIGPDKFGAIAFAQAVVLYFNLITNLGTNLYAPREIAVNKGDHFKISSLVSNILFMKILFLLVAISTYIAVVYAVPKFSVEKVLFMFTGGFLIITALSPVWFFQGIEKMANIAIANLLSRAFGVFLIFTVIHRASDYIYVPLINILAQMLGLLFMYYIIFAKEKIKIVRPSISSMKKIAMESLPLFVSNISISIYTGINAVVLGFLTNNTIVGYYSAAERLVRAGLSIQGQLGVVFYPYISKMVSISKEKAIILIKKAFVVTMLFAIPAMIFIFFNASFIIGLLFGAKFLPSIIPLRIMSFLFIALALSNIFGMQIFLPFGKRNELMKAAIFTVFLDIILLIILCPMLHAIGAALSYSLSETFVSFWMFFKVKNMKIEFLNGKVLYRFLFFIFTLLVINVMLNTHLNASIVRLVLSVVTYMMLVILFGFVNLKEKSVLIGAH